jgi:hypothetical protein
MDRPIGKTILRDCSLPETDSVYELEAPDTVLFVRFSTCFVRLSYPLPPIFVQKGMD